MKYKKILYLILVHLLLITFNTSAQVIQSEIGFPLLNPEMNGRVYTNSFYLQYKKFNIGILGHFEYGYWAEALYGRSSDGQFLNEIFFTSYYVSGSNVLNYTDKYKRGNRSQGVINGNVYANVNYTTIGLGLLMEYNFIDYKNINIKARAAPIILRNRYQFQRITYINADVKKLPADEFISRVDIRSHNIYEDINYGVFLSLGIDYQLTQRIRVGMYATLIGPELPYFSNYISYSFK